jgi:hypothetical protein
LPAISSMQATASSSALWAVGLQEAPGVGDQAHRLQAKARRIGPSADGQENPVSGQGLGGAARGGLDGEVHAGLAGLGTGHLGTETEVDPLLGQDPLEGLGNLTVHARADTIQVFDHGHLGAQPAPDRAQLEADNARSNDHQGLGNLRKGQGARGVDDAVAVDLQARKA